MSAEYGILLTTTPTVPGYKLKRVIGIVTASACRTRGLGGRLLASIESVVGGKGEAYLKEIEKAREEALRRLSEKARALGANAVVGIDFETTEILEGFIVVNAIGTAVVLEPASPEVPPLPTPAPTAAAPPKPAEKARVCPWCGRPATWIEQYKRWYCYHCGRYLPE